MTRVQRRVFEVAVTLAAVAIVAAGVHGCGTTDGHASAARANQPPLSGLTQATKPTGTTAPTRSTTSSVSTSTTSTVPSAGAISPTTGLPVPASNLHRPAIVVKMDNVAGALPQSGINAADVVYEELVEGGLTRLAAVFQSQDANPVGPVRSGRTTDIAIASDLGTPLLAFSGANAIFLPELRAAPVVDVDAEAVPGAYYRMGPHVEPHNLYTSTQALYAAAGARGGTPPQLFPFRAAGTPMTAAGSAPASAVSLNFPATSVSWSWDPNAGDWTRTQDGALDTVAGGGPVTAANVIIQSVPYQTVAWATGEGLPAPEPIPGGQLIGSGPAWVLSGGSVAAGSWSRSSMGSLTTYTDSSGNPIALSPGRTWVELLPTGSSPQVQG